MSNSEGRGKSKGQLAQQRMYIHMLMLILIFAALGTGVFFLFHGRLAVGSEGKAAFESLKGRWQRPDGGYVVDIRDVDASGKMMATYFNPRPINVSRAQAALDGKILKVFIELRDINYPGATYNLTY